MAPRSVSDLGHRISGKLFLPCWKPMLPSLSTINPRSPTSSVALRWTPTMLKVTAVDQTVGKVSFEVKHQYLDDGAAPGNGTLSDTSTIAVTVTAERISPISAASQRAFMLGLPVPDW